uniref:AlNc14C19G1951 protein n=1 Tax=Albugo laibachii Nc14 TaxID=890382 RepID=F0W4Y0_9STRA|nr:AlNc14C19G1951 [Albugo laibachii Nc14]|eukprot:CCA16170.1 AlNc14C19G1951 [Albugo laibachii Nc14]
MVHYADPSMKYKLSRLNLARTDYLFSRDAAEYATYILNTSPIKANEGRKAHLQLLTKCAAALRDILVFGQACTVHRNIKN